MICPNCKNKINDTNYYDLINKTEDEDTILNIYYYCCNSCGKKYSIKRRYETIITSIEIEEVD